MELQYQAPTEMTKPRPLSTRLRDTVDTTEASPRSTKRGATPIAQSENTRLAYDGEKQRQSEVHSTQIGPKVEDPLH